MMRGSLHKLQTVTHTMIIAVVFSLFVCCTREPLLHLFDGGEVAIELPILDLELNTYWDYLDLDYGVAYDWRAEWYYGWDAVDEEIFGPIGYTEPNTFNLRRYYTGTLPFGEHIRVLANTIKGTSFRGQYSWGYWDVLVWNDVDAIGGVQSLNFDETSTLEYVTAYTNMSMHNSRHAAPKYTRAFYEPEALFSAYEQGVSINRDLEGFVYDPERNVYIKKLDMVLMPITYIYLTQVILHNNHNKIVGVDGSGILSGVSRTMNVNTGLSGDEAISIYYNTRFKAGCNKEGESVDIIGGRLLTFGICEQNANRIKTLEEVKDENSHYLDVTMHFNNGNDSTFVFDVTDQVRNRWKGGVLTVELDMDTVSIPSRTGGSAFDAIVKDFEEETHEFPL